MHAQKVTKKKKKKATKKKKAKTASKLTITRSARALDRKLLTYIEKSNAIVYPVQVSDVRHCISTGLYGLDLIWCGGLRRGRFYTILGMPSDGKSTLIQEIVAALQRQKIRIFHFDIEGGSSRKYMTKQGIIPPDEIEIIGDKEYPKYRLKDGSRGYYYFQPETGDESYQMLYNLLDMLPRVPLDEDGKPIDGPPTAAVLTDSYESMVPEGVDIDQNPIGAAARMHSRYQKVIKPLMRRVGAVSVATNQIRMKIMAFGNPETDGGGLALQFYADAKARLRRRKEKKEGNRYISEVKIKCTKNKMADPFHEYSARLIIGRGFDHLHDRLEFLRMCGELEVERGKYMIDGKKYPYGKARKLMDKPEWKKKCRAISRQQSTYDWFFGVDNDEDL